MTFCLESKRPDFHAEHPVPLVCKILISVKAVGVLAALACRKGSFKLLGSYKWECKNNLLVPTMRFLGPCLFLVMLCPDAFEK